MQLYLPDSKTPWDEPSLCGRKMCVLLIFGEGVEEEKGLLPEILEVGISIDSRTPAGIRRLGPMDWRGSPTAYGYYAGR